MAAESLSFRPCRRPARTDAASVDLREERDSGGTRGRRMERKDERAEMESGSRVPAVAVASWMEEMVAAK